MPLLRRRVVFETGRGVRAFLGLEAGLTLGEAPPVAEESTEELLHLAREKDREIERLRRKISADTPAGALAGGVDPAKVVWIFGVARVGSTWLGSMMGEVEGHTLWNEPRVGSLFGDFYYGRGAHRSGRHGILGGPARKRSRAIRAFFLTAAGAKFGRMVDGGYLVVKEPNGSMGAPLLAQALPESRLIFMVRDPRDVVSSGLGAATEGGWYAEARERRGTPKEIGSEEVVQARAKRYVKYISRSLEAYEAHEGSKTLVRYEELRADALGTMQRIYRELGMPVDEDEVARAVEKHSWENIPEEKKGPNKFYRKASPGGWREDLTEEQARTVEEITAPLLREFYPDGDG